MMKHVATAAMWVALAIMSVAFFGGVYFEHKAHNDFEISCIAANGRINGWNGNCEK